MADIDVGPECLTTPQFPVDQLPPPTGELGPDSLLWRFADHRINLGGISAALRQTMLPKLGLGVYEHSDFMGGPWERVFKSRDQVMGSIFDPAAEEVAQEVRNAHRNIRGTDEDGNRYHALEPETFWYAHAEFHSMFEKVPDVFSLYGFTDYDREQLFAETNAWYERYGLPMSPVPDSYKEFKDKMRTIHTEVLEITPAAEQVLGLINNRLSRSEDRVPGISEKYWRFLRLPTSEIVRLTAIGGMPTEVRDRFPDELKWSEADEFAYRQLVRTVKGLWPFLTQKKRYDSRSWKGIQHAEAQRAKPAQHTERDKSQILL